MILLKACLLLLVQCILCDILAPDPEDEVMTINIWNVPKSRRIPTQISKKKHGLRNHHSKNKKGMRGSRIKNDIPDFFECLRESKGDYNNRIITCLAQDNNIPNIKKTATDALKKNLTQDYKVVYKCFGKMETIDDDKKHNAAQLMKCLMEPNVEKAIKNMKSAKNSIKIFTAFQKCLAESNASSYEGKVAYCMDNNPNYDNKDLLKYLRINNYKMDYIQKGYNDKWGIKMKLDTTLFLNSKEANKGKRKDFDDYNWDAAQDPSLNAAPNKKIIRMINSAIQAVKKAQ